MRVGWVATVLVVLAVISGCSKSGTTTQPVVSTDFNGSLMQANGGGFTLCAVTISLHTPSPVAPSGTFRLESSVGASASVRSSGGAPIDLTGSYDGGTKTIALTGPNSSMTGVLSNGVLRGTFTGTGGTGAFSAQQRGTGADTVKIYCGAGTDRNGNGVVAAVGIRGVAVDGTASFTSGNATTALSGTFTPSDSSITIANPLHLGTSLAWGRLGLHGMALDFVDAAGDTATWSGTVGGCP
jgi:hypothetical protein